MKKVLIINSSARGVLSHSRKLTDIFLAQWKSKYADAIIVTRELGALDVPHIDPDWITAVSKLEEVRTTEEIAILSRSETFIAELIEADIIVLGVPMYNWSIPSTLKAYIDHVLRVGRTFKVDPGKGKNPYVGLLERKTMCMLLSRGGQWYEKGEANEHMNFQNTYLRTVFKMMGIDIIIEIAINGTSLDRDRFADSLTDAEKQIQGVIQELIA